MNIFLKQRTYAIVALTFLAITDCSAMVTVTTVGKTGKSITNNLSTLDQMNQPNIITWYSGEDGLTKRSAHFYQKLCNGLENLAQKNKKTTQWTYRLYLYDLWAWRYLRKQKSALTEPDYSGSILFNNRQSKKLKNERWQLLFSSDFFSWLASLTNAESTLFKKILDRPGPWDLSKKLLFNKIVQPNGISIKTSFLKDLTFLSKASQLENDTAEVYSALQYLEGLYLALDIATKAMQKNSETPISIILLLPAGEADYYLLNDNGKSFGQDLSNLLMMQKNVIKQPLKIIFIPFTYQGPCTKRPYTLVKSDSLADTNDLKEILYEK